MPYHDFFAYYAPGQFYWPAVLFAVFGKQILVARLGALFFVATAAAALFALCRRAGVDPLWSAVPVTAVLLPIGTGAELLVCDPALGLVLVAGAVLVGSPGRVSSCLGAGLVVGVAALFRHDFAAYGALAAVAAAMWSPGARARRLLALLGGAFVVAFPAYGLLAWRGPRALIKALLLDPPTIMSYRTLPYSFELGRLGQSARAVISTLSPDALALLAQTAVIVTPPLALLVILGRMVVGRCTIPARRAPALVFLAVSAAGLAAYALGRSDWYHVYPLHVAAAGVLTLVLAPDRAGPRPRRWALDVSMAATLAFLLATMLATHVALAAGARPLGLPRASHVVVPEPFLWIEHAVRDIWATGTQGPIFVAAPRHDRVMANAVILYFLAERHSATRYHAFDPAVTTRHDVQQQIVHDLARQRTPTVLLHTATTLWDEPNKSRESSSVFLLDQYLRAEFVARPQTGPYLVLLRRS